MVFPTWVGAGAPHCLARGRCRRSIQVTTQHTNAGLDASIAAALDAGRAVIVPSAQRAAALRLAFARRQQARGLGVWNSPEIFTFEAWLARAWRSATLAAVTPHNRQLLSRSQERQLWESALQQLSSQGDDPQLLQPHAAALMRAATRAAAAMLELSRTAATDEELLLAEALRKVQAICAERGLLSLNLAGPEDMPWLAGVRAPLIVGEPHLTALQAELQRRFWPGEELLDGPAFTASTEPSLQRAPHLEGELAACARWCRDQLQQDGAWRLLVVSAWTDPGAHTQGALLWRALSEQGNASDEQRYTWLAVEGGEPLHHQTLIADALTALSIAGETVDTEQLLRLLRSPYFRFGDEADCGALQHRLRKLGLARWSFDALQNALIIASESLPAAAAMLRWLQQTRALHAEVALRSATDWADCFSRCLRAAGFAANVALDSRDAQRLSRWGLLLDEFAALDAAMPPLTLHAAQQALQRLARQSVHQSATGDAAITFTTQMHDPIAHYDGIWVMGLTETRWPAPPRPDPYVPLSEQRRSQWPEAGVTQRLQAAQWLLRRWQLRTGNLVLSYGMQEGDVHHRPSALLPRADGWWRDVAAEPFRPGFHAKQSVDVALPAMDLDTLTLPLRGGVERLRLQQECAFRAQAQWRLGAEPQAVLTDGIPSRLRGMLLHTLLDGLWGELQNQAQLLGLTPDAEQQLIARHWAAAVRANAAAGVRWLAQGVLERERVRALRVVQRVLELDRRERAAFVVRHRELDATLRVGEAALRMRIDRIDETASGQHVLVDYKSGEAGTIKLHEGLARPLQLAAYVAALADDGMEIGAALLLSLKPAVMGYAGIAGIDEPLPRRVRSVEDWPTLQLQWHAELRALLAAHLQGNAELAVSIAACRYCHLAAFCRRRALGDTLPDEEVDE